MNDRSPAQVSPELFSELFSELPPASRPELPAALFVDPAIGSDTASPEGIEGPLGKSRSQPFKTLSYALKQAIPGSVIYLQPGRYDAEQGEQFPLYIPPYVVIVGDVPTRGSEVAIVGSGDWESPTFGRQNVTLLPAEMAQVRGVTVTNPQPKGTGICIEAATATIAHCTVSHCGREGIFVTGAATPMILNCWLLQNGASGLTLTRYAKGEIQRSLFCQNRFGLTLSDFAAPLIYQSEISVNQVGIVLSGSSRPVLRENQIVANQGEGLVIFSQAVPDLGDRQSAGGNRFDNNGDVAIRNVGAIPVISVGNGLHPHAVAGAIEFRALQPIQTGGWEAETLKPTALRAELTAPDPAALQTAEIPIPADLAQHWSLPFAAEILARRIMGCFRDGTFQPDRPISYAQFAALAVRAFQSNQPVSDSLLSSNSAADDLQNRAADPGAAESVASQYPEGVIAQALQMGFIPADANAIFDPEQPLSRWQAIGWLVKGLNLSGGTPDLLRVFRDRVEIPGIAAIAVATAVAHRLLVLPHRDRLSPLLPVTRAEIAAWIYQALVLRGEVDIQESSAILTPLLQPPTIPPEGGQGGFASNNSVQADVQSSGRQAARFSTATDSPPRIAIELAWDTNQEHPAESPIVQVAFRVAAQLAERLAQVGMHAQLIQDPSSPDGFDRLPVIRQIQPTLLLQICLIGASNPEADAIGIRTQYGTSADHQTAALLHRTLLELLDLPDRQISPLPDPADSPDPVGSDSTDVDVPLLQVEVALLTEILCSADGINSSFCESVAEAFQQGLLRCFS